MQLIFEQVRLGGDRNFGYLLADREAKVGVVIDPAYAPELLVERAAAQDVRVTHVVNTHGHTDHIEGNTRAVEATGAKVAAFRDCPIRPDVPLDDGSALEIGALELRCLHTPGHAPDHLVLYEPKHRILITGDLIFVGKVGGTSNDGDARTEWESLQRVLAAVPDDATVWPGHDYGIRPSSTLALEREANPFLRCRDVDAFLALKRDWATFKGNLGLK
jgi:hydroxyacylglutathione hydrolase